MKERGRFKSAHRSRIKIREPVILEQILNHSEGPLMRLPGFQIRPHAKIPGLKGIAGADVKYNFQKKADHDHECDPELIRETKDPLCRIIIHKSYCIMLRAHPPVREFFKIISERVVVQRRSAPYIYR